MEYNNKDIESLIEFQSAVSHPWGLIVDMLIAQYSQLGFLNTLRRGVPRVREDDMQRSGFNGFELGLWSGSFFRRNWEIYENRLTAFQRSDYEFKRFHACFEMLPQNLAGVYFNIADGSDSNVAALKSQIAVAHNLAQDESTILVVHPGFVTSKNEKDIGIDNIKKVIDQVLYFAEENNVVIALENLPYVDDVYFVGAFIEEIKEIVDDFNSDYVKATFDWGHLNVTAFQQGVVNNFDYIDEKIRMLGKDIVHAHLNYNRCCEKAWAPVVSNKKRFIRRFIEVFNMSFDVDLFSLDSLDQHMPLIRAKEMYQAGLRRNMHTLFEASSLHTYGCVTHEVEPQKVFGILSHRPEGARTADHVKDVSFVAECSRSRSVLKKAIK
jgi:sugar phosphate isomerase/epimerase